MFYSFSIIYSCPDLYLVMSRSFILPKGHELYTHDRNQRTGSDDGTHDAGSSIETNGLE